MVPGTVAPVESVSVKDAEVSVVGSTGAENRAVIGSSCSADCAPSAGSVDRTTSDVIVKTHETAVWSGVPSAALTVAATRAVYVVPGASGALGVNVAVRSEERRVGKEGRYRWASVREKKKTVR